MNDVLTSVSAVLSLTPARWTSLTQTLSAELLSLPPAPGEWSALECLQHLIDTEPVFQFRIDAFLAGRDFPAFDPDSEGTKPDATRSPVELAADYARLRAASLAALDRLTASDLDRRAVHQELGRVTLSEMIHEWAAHDLMH
ncbi:MAG TPA: DinB family protein, partial [Anaerolineae bacterium]|nr:DinB family protein [Anaerolineae bacterium]